MGLVLGIISLAMALMPVVRVTAILLALIGLGLSIAGLFRARTGRATNFGSAMAGPILSSLAALVGIIWMVITIVAASSLDGPSGDLVGKGGDPADAAQVRSGEEAASDKEVKLGKAITIDDLSWYGAKVYSKRGQAYDANPMAEPAKGQALPKNIDLRPKGTVDGWILFEVRQLRYPRDRGVGDRGRCSCIEQRQLDLQSRLVRMSDMNRIYPVAVRRTHAVRRPLSA